MIIISYYGVISIICNGAIHEWKLVKNTRSLV